MQTIMRKFGTDKSHLKMYQLDNGYLFASRKATPVIMGNHKPDAVVVVAHDKQGRLLVIKEFRHPVGDYIWALPAGLVDDGESPVTAAVREVKEETGLTLTNHELHYINSYACPGMSDEQVAIVSGFVEGNLSDRFKEKDEDITAFLLSPDDMIRMDFDKSTTKMSMWLAFCLI